MDAHHTVATTRRNPRRQIRNGQRAAARRAITAAGFYLRGDFPSIAIAAESCGSCTAYVQAAIVLIRAGNKQAIDSVLTGVLPLLAIANELRPTVKLVEAYRNARPQDLKRAGRMVGPEKLFTTMVEPAIDSDSTTEELGLRA
jgi:hypothetical protein